MLRHIAESNVLLSMLQSVYPAAALKYVQLLASRMVIAPVL